MRRLVLLVLMGLLAGCTVLAPRQDQPGRTLSIAEIIKQARALQHKEQWSEALALLRNKGGAEPGDERIGSLEGEIRRDWNMQKRNSEDWILVYETRSLKQKLPHLQRLAKIDSDNLITRSRLLFWTKLLESKVAALISCGSMHLYLDPALAEACTILSEEIKPTQESSHLLAKIKKTRATEKSVQQNKKAVRVKRDLSQQRDRLLAQAKTRHDEGEYAESINNLQRLLKLVPNDAAAITLLEEVTIIRDQQVEKLIKFGDALYRDEQIDQAVSVWESAEKLDTGRADIASRIDRAMKVLERLREIKEEL